MSSLMRKWCDFGIPPETRGYDFPFDAYVDRVFEFYQLLEANVN